MKVLAFNGSPTRDKGNTAMILKPYLEGMREAGAEVELIYTNNIKIYPCTGELLCWGKNPGQCHISDDMQSLYPKLCKTDILVLAIPVYVPLPGNMQIFINRLIPLMNPILEMRDGRTRARFRENVKISKIVLVSSCGWWEKGNFGTVIRVVKELTEDVSVEFAGTVLRPHAEFLRENNEKTRDVINAVNQAGHQLIMKGKMSPEILDKVSCELVSLEKYIETNNQLHK